MKIKNIGKNQTEIYIDNLIILVSYETPVCFAGRLAGKTKKHYSSTTVKHINAFFRRHDIDPEKVNVVPQENIDNLLK